MCLFSLHPPSVSECVPFPHLSGWPSPAARVGRASELKCPQSDPVPLSDQSKSLLGSVPDSCSHSHCLHTPQWWGAHYLLFSHTGNLMGYWKENTEPSPRSAQVVPASSASLPRLLACLDDSPPLPPAQLCPGCSLAQILLPTSTSTISHFPGCPPC